MNDPVTTDATQAAEDTTDTGREAEPVRDADGVTDLVQDVSIDGMCGVY